MELQVMIWKEIIKNKPMNVWEQYSYIDHDGTTLNVPRDQKRACCHGHLQIIEITGLKDVDQAD